MLRLQPSVSPTFNTLSYYIEVNQACSRNLQNPTPQQHVLVLHLLMLIQLSHIAAVSLTIGWSISLVALTCHTIAYIFTYSCLVLWDLDLEFCSFRGNGKVLTILFRATISCSLLGLFWESFKCHKHAALRSCIEFDEGSRPKSSPSIFSRDAVELLQYIFGINKHLQLPFYCITVCVLVIDLWLDAICDRADH